MRLLGNACVCGSTGGATRLFETRDYNFGATNQRADFMKCRGCDALFPDSFPSADTLAEAYASYYTTPKARHGARKWLRKLIDATRRRHLLRGTPASSASVLDYGCGSGEFLVSLADAGYRSRLTGTDISQPQGYRTEAFQWQTLEAFERNGAPYDWITLSHVIEHLADPQSVLRRLKRVCALGGSVWISTPNARSVLISAFRGHARDLDFPRHRQVYSRESLRMLLEQAGFQVAFASSPRVDAVLNFASCARNLRRDPNFGRLRQWVVLTTALWRLALHLLKPRFWRSNDSPEIVAIATAATPATSEIRARH
ncbi:MAG: class I SAM-dependent methyltransferase [Pseudomonadota bacterium]|nr:class I SAM-dependent methyltransferase [Pseudomonadota bacterium]